MTEAATRISDRLVEVLDKLVALDAELEGFQQTVAGVRSGVPTAFAISALLLSLLLVFVAYTQVEMIRLYVGHWRLLGATSASLPPEAPVLAEVVIPVDEPPATANRG